jgi:hypothetical protein
MGMITYNFKLVCRCPHDNSVNIYDVLINSEIQIDVEDFVEFQDEIYSEKYLQEEIWELLSKLYDNVSITGTHLGVQVVTS